MFKSCMMTDINKFIPFQINLTEFNEAQMFTGEDLT